MRVGVDIGGTKTDAVVVDVDGMVLDSIRLPTGFGPGDVLDAGEAAVRGLAERTGIDPAGFTSIGVGIPGHVDSVTGSVGHAVNLGLDALELGPELERRLGAPVRIENDVNAAALGAFHVLQVPFGRSLAYLNLGTGLAGGLVLGGRLWRGSRGAAGEIGHIPIDPAGPECACGQRGCLELVASGSAVARQWPSEHPRPVLALFDAASRGDLDAVTVRDRLIGNVAAAVRLLVLTVDTDVVVIGGGISSIGDPLLEGVRGVLGSWAESSPFLASLELPGRVLLAPKEEPIAAVGAAMIGGDAADHAGLSDTDQRKMMVRAPSSSTRFSANQVTA